MLMIYYALILKYLNHINKIIFKKNYDKDFYYQEYGDFFSE